MLDSKSETKLYDIAKCITTILVVVAHSTRMYTSKGVFTPLNTSNFLTSLTTYIYSFHMPLFIFLSGSIYAYSISNGKYTNTLNFIKQKAKRLLIPYLAFGLFWVAPIMCLLGLSEQSYTTYCITKIIMATDARHLWYLLALFNIFLIAIVTKPLIMSSQKIYRILLFLLSLLLFFASRYIKTAHFQLCNALYYQLFFFIGVFFHLYYKTLIVLFKKIFPVFIVTPFILIGIFKYNPNLLSRIIYSIIGIIMILALSVFIIQRCEKLTTTPLYKYIHTNSFGIYLFHPMIIYILYFYLGQYDIPPIILCFDIAIISLVFSIIATKLFRVLRLKIFIGE